MHTQKHRYAVIMAGGSGTRLWPLSRKTNPKQFHSLLSKKTLIEETFDRVRQLVPSDHIFVSTTKEYRDNVLALLPDMRSDHLIIEPAPRGTAPAITLVASTLFSLDPKAVVATLHSDHAIDGTEQFLDSLRTAFAAVSKYPDKIGVVGINPTFPSTELGYIHMGTELPKVSDRRIFLVDSFREKPDSAAAKKYLSDWAYLWNAGYFIFSAQTFLKEAEKIMPETAKSISLFFSSKKNNTTEEHFYQNLPNEAVDQALIEKLDPEKRMVVPSEMGWADIGTWDTLFDFLRKTDASPCIVQGSHIDFKSKNCLIFGTQEKPVATVGLKDIIIVDTKDALLVARRGQAKDVKKIIEILKEQGKTECL